MRVLIKSTSCRELHSKKTGQAFFIQTAALETGDDFPRPFDILHDDLKKAYPPGLYEFAPDAIYVGTSGLKAGKLLVSPRLVPAKSSAPRAA